MKPCGMPSNTRSSFSTFASVQLALEGGAQVTEKQVHRGLPVAMMVAERVGE